MLDEVDLALVHALSLNGRASFTRLGEVLGVSAQTVQRRYAKLRDVVGLRVAAALEPAIHCEQQWLVRISAPPSSAQSVARALARRDDTSWVRLASGGTEIIAVVTSDADRPTQAPHQLLLRDVPKTAAVTGVAAHQLLHVYRGGPSPWSGRLSSLTPDQEAAITPPSTQRPARRRHVDADDRQLVDALSGDGRLSARALATRTGLTESNAARRIANLIADGSIYFDLDLDDTAAFGITDRTFLWMSAPPHSLDRVATALTAHPQLAFIAAATGPSNLVAFALTKPGQLHHYITVDLAGLEAITALETAPVLHTLKTIS